MTDVAAHLAAESICPADGERSSHEIAGPVRTLVVRTGSAATTGQRQEVVALGQDVLTELWLKIDPVVRRVARRFSWLR